MVRLISPEIIFAASQDSNLYNTSTSQPVSKCSSLFPRETPTWNRQRLSRYLLRTHSWKSTPSQTTKYKSTRRVSTYTTVVDRKCCFDAAEVASSLPGNRWRHAEYSPGYQTKAVILSIRRRRENCLELLSVWRLNVRFRRRWWA